jgi:DNA-binding HxlR family transcriptional regulator
VRDYGQFCPIARTSELFAERWTPIIVRNLLVGCRTYNEIRQGAPGIPTALLTQRLRALERHGVVVRVSEGRATSYELTPKGRALQKVCDAMGDWGAEWLEITPHHLDPAYVLWATVRLVDVAALPDRTVVVRVDLADRPGTHHWMVLRRPRPELCSTGTGYVEDLVCETDAACLVDLHLKRTTYRGAMRDGRLSLAGPPALVRGFAGWFRTSPFADLTPDSALSYAATSGGRRR